MPSWWSGATACRSIRARATGSTPRVSPPCCRRSSRASASSAPPAGAATSPPACSSSDKGSPSSPCSTPTPCSLSWSSRRPTSGACSSTSADTARRSPVCCKRGAMTPPRHLLVVDDEPHVGLLLRPLLEQQGFRLRLARTLGEARAALQDQAAPRLDAMLLDLHLPDGSGLDLLAELRADAATQDLPVLVVTAEGEDHVLREVTALGALLLTKPFSPTKLMRRL